MFFLQKHCYLVYFSLFSTLFLSTKILKCVKCSISNLNPICVIVFLFEGEDNDGDESNGGYDEEGLELFEPEEGLFRIPGIQKTQ